MALPLPAAPQASPRAPRHLSLETATVPAPAPAAARVPSVDVLRGLVMVVMVLDHVRDYLTDVRFDPLDLARTSGPLYFTRWITHFCAPTFVLLAGMSAWMAGRRRTRPQLAWFLATRGLWLVLLEVTVVSFGWYFNVRFEHGAILQVIWAIGVAMIALSALVFLPRPVIAALAVAAIAGHNLLDGASPAWLTADEWRLLHVPGTLTGAHVLVMYPLIPWVAVLALGYVLGGLLDLPDQRRRRALLGAGAAAIGAFVVLRAVNGYGDPVAWSEASGRTLLAFLNTTKYPPSLAYLLMTLGPGLVLLAAFERARGPAARVLLTFGRVPLFFYVAHLYLVHAFALAAFVAVGLPWSGAARLFIDYPETYGFGLGVVYAAWALAIALLYPCCRWFGERKRAGRGWWWSYL
ncbi:MAG TPA: heparan-alpha-glucosaminide N-acetyltransferase domain-containing protein [Gemmatimonadales bacterium]|nr:heparan-alpha-glucosaminide N-acetyltransferase domain-containing protein [Gemmatimonadales bacterium]